MRLHRLAVIAVALVLAHAGALLVLPEGAERRLVSDLLQAVAGALALAACVGAARRSGAYARLFWGTTAAAFAIWTVAGVWWMLDEWVHGPRAYVLGGVGLLYGVWFAPIGFVLLLPDDRDPPRGRWLQVLDFLQVTLLFATAYLWATQVRVPGEAPEITSLRLQSDIYTWRDVLGGVLLTARAALTTSRRQRRLFGTLAAFFVLYAVLGVVEAEARLRLGVVSGSIFDLCFSVSLAVAVILIARWSEKGIEARLPAPRLRDFAALQLTPAIIPILVAWMSAQVAPFRLGAALAVIAGTFVLYSLRILVSQWDQRRAELTAQQSETRLRMLFDTSRDAILHLDLDGVLVYASRAAYALFGWLAEDVMGQRLLPRLCPVARGELERVLAGLRSGGDVPARLIGAVWARDDGSTVPVELQCAALREHGARASGLLVVLRDVTERQTLEEQLRHSQRMESIGLLAGGVAHDYNNQLTAIRASAALALDTLPPDAPAREDLLTILDASDRSAALTRQLLAFARRQRQQLSPVPLVEVVERMRPMLRAATRADVELEYEIDAAVPPVLADATQLEQVVLNLVVNARDAMPRGGTVRIKLGPAELARPLVRDYASVPAGRYVRLAVSDGGTGMSEAVRARIFEPFFTTKKTGKGTGLGLAVVYGIVKQSGGFVFVDSAPGAGSSFQVLLPVWSGEQPPDAQSNSCT
ncbi:MAG TPA: ATP-binding protein [Gemmatimonadales bacterium]|nr:ATP-binding protein [Gemmatimonadales bacterium]